jgi:hypothetical protein
METPSSMTASMLIFNLGSWFKISIHADFELGSFALQNSNKTLETATSMSPKAIKIIEENEMKTKQSNRNKLAMALLIVHCSLGATTTPTPTNGNG